MAQKYRLILASASPRRAEILRNAGFDFEVVPAHIDETPRAKEPVEDYVRRLAEEKGRIALEEISRDAGGAAIVVGADTTVIINNHILGKPVSAEDAREMLRRLSARAHEVYTGLAVLAGKGAARTAVEKTRVTFAEMSEKEIADYVETGEPFDKAGAYAIQGRGGKFISHVEGCYFNVMGLPLARLYAMLRELGM